MKVIDRDGNVAIPRGKPLRFVMADSVQRFVRWVARINGVTADQLMLTTLVDVEIDPDAPIYLFCRRDGNGNTSLVATQDNHPYREHLIAIRDGRPPDDPLIAVELTAGSERGQWPSTSDAGWEVQHSPEHDQVLSARQFPLQVVKRIHAPFDCDDWLFEIKHDGFRARAIRNGFDVF
jgi:hypothetical protein